MVAITVGFATPVAAFTPLPVANDPLLRMPGTQPADGVALEDPQRCFNCHDGYDRSVEPGFHWQGSMMSQAARDPLFWAAMTVAAQDSVWLLGRPNAADLCLRCHTPNGWLAGHSDPPNGSRLTAGDFDGVSCDGCHRMYDPFFKDSYAGVRESSDWLNYWDETNASGTPSSTAAAATRSADSTQAAALRFFNGNPLFSADAPAQANWTRAVTGQYFVSGVNEKRGPFADATAKHQKQYSRFHKSRYFCGTCHDVSNPVLANFDFEGTVPGDQTTVLPSEASSASSYNHVERTFSEFMLSAFGAGAGAPGTGVFAPTNFTTGRPGNVIATCQDCHMSDRSGVACNKAGATLRPSGSVEHPNSGQPLHDLTGANTVVPTWLAAAVPGSPNYDPVVESLLRQGPAVLTLDLTQGLPLRPEALLSGVDRATQNLKNAASLENATFDTQTGVLSLRIQNHTGHKLITGYPEGRRMFVTIEAKRAGEVVYRVNPPDFAAKTLKGLDPQVSSISPPLGPNEEYRDDLVYEVGMRSALTGEDRHTFHFVLATSRYKDNRIPPQGFRIEEAAAFHSEPVWQGASAPDYFTPEEYAGGYDDVTVSLPPDSDEIGVWLVYQTTTREYVEFLRDEINGVGLLTSPTPSGEAQAYIAQSDPFFSGLAAWGDTVEQLYVRTAETNSTPLGVEMQAVKIYPYGQPSCAATPASRSASMSGAWLSIAGLLTSVRVLRRRMRRKG